MHCTFCGLKKFKSRCETGPAVLGHAFSTAAFSGPAFSYPAVITWTFTHSTINVQ